MNFETHYTPKVSKRTYEYFYNHCYYIHLFYVDFKVIIDRDQIDVSSDRTYEKRFEFPCSFNYNLKTKEIVNLKIDCPEQQFNDTKEYSMYMELIELMIQDEIELVKTFANKYNKLNKKEGVE